MLQAYAELALFAGHRQIPELLQQLQIVRVGTDAVGVSDYEYRFHLQIFFHLADDFNHPAASYFYAASSTCS
jgi:hypothetical protein